MGGGTFDVSLLSIDDGIFEVKVLQVIHILEVKILILKWLIILYRNLEENIGKILLLISGQCRLRTACER